MKLDAYLPLPVVNLLNYWNDRELASRDKLSRSLFEIMLTVGGVFLVKAYGRNFGISLSQVGLVVPLISKNVFILGMSQNWLIGGMRGIIGAVKAKNLAKCVQQAGLALCGYLITTEVFRERAETIRKKVVNAGGGFLSAILAKV